jgi:hypothetical protein
VGEGVLEPIPPPHRKDNCCFTLFSFGQVCQRSLGNHSLQVVRWTEGIGQQSQHWEGRQGWELGQKGQMVTRLEQLNLPFPWRSQL